MDFPSIFIPLGAFYWRFFFHVIKSKVNFWVSVLWWLIVQNVRWQIRQFRFIVATIFRVRKWEMDSGLKYLNSYSKQILSISDCTAELEKRNRKSHMKKVMLLSIPSDFFLSPKSKQMKNSKFTVTNKIYFSI